MNGKENFKGSSRNLMEWNDPERMKWNSLEKGKEEGTFWKEEPSEKHI